MFSLPVQYERSIRQIEHKSLKLDPARRYIVWWYGGILSNRNRAHVPLVVVWFRQLNRDGTLGNLVRHPIAISFLRQFRIGSVWHNQKSVEQLQFDTKYSKVHFSGDQWKSALSVASHRESTNLNLIPSHHYGLQYQTGDRSKILLLEGSSGRLLIPCLEFLARCYGHCEEINRILVNQRWSDVVDYFRLDAPVTHRDGAWSIKLPYFARNTDAHLLAHLRYDEFARLQARRIQADIEQQLFGVADQSRAIAATNSPRYAFPTIGPWFKGDAEIEVEGIPLDNGDFLGLRITAYSVPSKPPIYCEIDEFHSNFGEEGGGRPRPPFNTKHPPENETTPATDAQAPDGGSNAVIVIDPSIRILGDPAAISIKRNSNEGRGGNHPPPPEDSEQSAPGDRNGQHKGTGRSYFISQAVLDSDGAILDLWNGLLHLQKTYKKVITSVNCYTFSEGLINNEGDPPKLVSLLFEEKQFTLSDAAKKWVQFDSKSTDKIRAALIVHVTSPEREAYLFEVQRKRIYSKESDENGQTVKEQKYCGLVVEAPKNKSPESWIPEVLFQIAEHRGIMSRVLPKIPDLNGQDYRRSSSESDAVTGESTARSALKKVAIDIPRLKKSTTNPGEE